MRRRLNIFVKVSTSSTGSSAASGGSQAVQNRKNKRDGESARVQFCLTVLSSPSLAYTYVMSSKPFAYIKTIHLASEIGSINPCVEWISVRPCGLVDADVPTNYPLYDTPQDASGDINETTRAMARSICDLICDEALWNHWKFKMPVVVDNRK